MKFFRILTLSITAAFLWFSPAASETIIIAVRHAEKTGDALKAKGFARAEALVGALAGVNIDAIYTPEYNRNQQTAAPLAADRGLTIAILPDHDVAMHLLDGNENRTVAWVGNKSNLKLIWEDLEAEGPPPLEYGDLFILTIGANGAPSVKRMHFGE